MLKNIMMVVLCCTVAGCVEEEPNVSNDAALSDATMDAALSDTADGTASDGTPEEDSTDGCDDVRARFEAYVDANNSCASPDDCAIATEQLSCDCHYALVVNPGAVEGARALLAEAEACGLSEESFFQCEADAAPVGSVITCTRGTCSSYVDESCLGAGQP